MKRRMSSEEKQKRLEKKILAEYSGEEVRRHLEFLTSLTRLAGTEDEKKAADYIEERLNEYGVECEIHEFDAYISHPGEASVEIVSPVQKSLACLAFAFIASTPPEGIEAELVYVGDGSEGSYRDIDVKGKIALAGPVGKEDHVEVGRVAEKYGAVAQIHINKGDPRALDLAQLRNSWGSPIPETMGDVPATPSVSIGNEDGNALITLARQGKVVARIRAEAWRGYRKVRFPMATVKGRREPEKYVLYAAHYCGWYKGATDNAAANAVLLEVARVFSKYRRSLDRSVKFAWWTGHTQGTFAGSTWYADHFWDDLRENAIAYFVMDGCGRIHSSGYEARSNEEIRGLHEKAIKDTLGLDVKSRRHDRSGDQSFWGIGIPSCKGGTLFTPEQSAALGGKPAWYTHTIDDTIDKVDVRLLEIDFKVNAISILRLCNDSILPIEFVTVAEVIEKRLKELQKEDKAGLDLASLLTGTEEFRRKAVAVNDLVQRRRLIYLKKGPSERLENQFRMINAGLMGLSRILMPALFSKSGKYGQDPIRAKSKLIPGLQSVETLNSMDPASDVHRASRTALMRERNRFSDALKEANGLLDRILETK